MTASPDAAIQPSSRHLWLLALGALVLTLALGAPAAHAERALLPTPELKTKTVPGGEIEGACGVAVSAGLIYVSDYYRHRVDVFSLVNDEYQSQILGNPHDGPCGLATSASGALYANDWHEGASRLLPSSVSFDSANSTGVAVDQASGDVYVDDRTYVAVYDPAVLNESSPLQIIGAGGTDPLEDAYGVAVSGGKVYVPDAGDDTVKVYEPAIDPVNPARVIDGAALPSRRFNSLVDASIAIDPSNEHVLVVDNLQPGFEHPEAAIYEFGPAGQLLGGVAKRIVDGEPSGLAFSGGVLYATTGNDEGANVLGFGPYTVGSLSGMTLPALTAPAEAAVGPSPASSDSLSPPAIEPQLRLLSSAPGTAGSGATIRAVVSSAGTISAVGRGLRALRATPIGPGSRLLRLRLDSAGRKALAKAKLQRLAVGVSVTFAPRAGDPVRARGTVTFRSAIGAKR